MKGILVLIYTIVAFAVFSQADCNVGEYICNDNGFGFTTNSSGNGLIDELPDGNNISNPSTNPGTAGNSGCLLSNELNPTWLIISISEPGELEFTIGQSGGTGFYDWAMWPYYDTGGANACDDILNNNLPPVACNWNGASAGFTGMTSPGFLPSGGDNSNFENALQVEAGDQFIICFSNFSGLVGTNVPLQFGNSIPGNNNPNGAGVTCDPVTVDQTICEGESASVTITVEGFSNPTFEWLVTDGVSDIHGGVDVQVTPGVTTNYSVIVREGTYEDTVDFTIFVETPPTPNAGDDAIVCLGDDVNLVGTGSNTNNTFDWSHLSTATGIVNYLPNATSLTPTVTISDTGVYQFILSETSSVCGVVSDTLEIVVEDLTLDVSLVDPSCGGAADGEIIITSQDAEDFSFDGGTTWQVENFNVGMLAGNYTVCARTINGCSTCENVELIDPEPVIISVSVDTIICQNGTGYLSASATGGTSYTYHWNTSTNTSSQLVVNPINSTTYTVYAENELGCVSSSESIDVTVREPLSGSISGLDTICPQYSTIINANVVGGLGEPYSFNWSSGESFTGMGMHAIEVSPLVTTNYTVTITDECESSPLVLQTNIRVAPSPVPDHRVLNPVQCEPAVFDIVNMTDPTMSQYVYWKIGDKYEYVNQDTITTPSLSGGSHDIHMIITSFEGCVDSTTFEDAIYVTPSPVADFSYSPNPVYMLNTDVYFQNLSFNGDTYQWYFEEGYPSQSTETDVEVRFPDGVTGTYEVVLITTSELGCIDTLRHNLVVESDVLIFVPNTFTPDGDEFNQTWKVHMEGIDIYDFELLIFNRWGEIVWESHDLNVAWDGVYRGKDLPAGMYTWTITTKDLLNDNKRTFQGHVNLLR